MSDDRKRLEEMAKANNAKRLQAEQDQQKAEQDANVARANQAQTDQQKTQELIDLLTPVFNGFKLPDSGKAVSVRSEKSPNRYFFELKEDHLIKAEIAVEGSTMFVARSRIGGYFLSEINKGVADKFGTAEELKEDLIKRVAALDNEKLKAMAKPGRG